MELPAMIVGSLEGAATPHHMRTNPLIQTSSSVVRRHPHSSVLMRQILEVN